MSYQIALNKAWDDLAKANVGRNITVKFLADEYSIDPEDRRVLSLSCNVAAKDFTAILILHYLAQRIKGLPALSGEWLTFRELSGVEGYEAAFRKRSIEPVIRKYGSSPEGIFSALERLPGRKDQAGDAGLVLEAFEGVPVRVVLWHADEDFGPDANIFFDKSITRIFCTEDIVVLAGIVAALL